MHSISPHILACLLLFKKQNSINYSRKLNHSKISAIFIQNFSYLFCYKLYFNN